MPAAAVIPAPRAYTDIAAVKTLVVGCWAQVCWVAGGPVCPGWGGSAPLPGVGWRPWNSTPSGMLLCPTFHDGENSPCPKPPSVGAEAGSYPTLVCGHHRAWACPMQLTPGPPHRGPPSQPPWKTQCAQSSRLAGCLSMEWQSIDRMWQLMLCWPWCPSRGTWCPGPPCPVWSPPGAATSWLGSGRHPSGMRGLLGVKGIAAPEVKFLDRCQTNCSEGALHVPVRRSRMRVWGAKMIRHRRSPRL